MLLILDFLRVLSLLLIRKIDAKMDSYLKAALEAINKIFYKNMCQTKCLTNFRDFFIKHVQQLEHEYLVLHDLKALARKLQAFHQNSMYHPQAHIFYFG